ncbi:Bacterial lipid A biosynthesis acyltransferase [Beggiatoa sp. PS]|nr:Bacterial lipid A biosynthesis acyltransferase [Beggiatoa sp. PS]
MTDLPLYAPRYWLLWITIGILWCLTRLPYRWQLAVGRQLGHLTYWLAPRRRKIAKINLALCFPELSDKQRYDLLRSHFESLGMGLLEMLSAWWLPNATLKPLGLIQGIEYLHTAFKRGKGVILLSAHFTSFEMGTRFLTMHTAIHGIYRPHENPLIEYVMKKSRENRAEKAIPKHAVRDMLKSLKQNKALWIASDQNFDNKNTVFANFFEIPAATNPGISRFAQISGATVIPFFTQRLENAQGYKMILQPPLENFPSGDLMQDAFLMNQIIAEQIRKAPEQYLWVHRRFKTRPTGEEKIY